MCGSEWDDICGRERTRGRANDKTYRNIDFSSDVSEASASHLLPRSETLSRKVFVRYDQLPNFFGLCHFPLQVRQSSQVRLKSIEKMATRWLFVHLTFRFWPKIQQQVPWWHNWLSLNYLENKRPGFQASCCLFENQTVKDEVEPTWLELQWIQNDFK